MLRDAASDAPPSLPVTASVQSARQVCWFQQRYGLSHICRAVSIIWWMHNAMLHMCLQTLFFAEYDLAFFKTRPEMMRHLRKCKLQHPPGDEIYRRHYAGSRSVSMFEVCPPPCC